MADNDKFKIKYVIGSDPEKHAEELAEYLNKDYRVVAATLCEDKTIFAVLVKTPAVKMSKGDGNAKSANEVAESMQKKMDDLLSAVTKKDGPSAQAAALDFLKKKN